MIDATRATYQFIRRTSAVSSVLCIIIIVCATVAGHRASVFSVLAGFIIANLSFMALSVVVIFSITGRKHAALMAVLGMVKMGVVGFVLWILLRKNLIEPVGFSIGFSTVVVALLMKSCRSGKK